MIILFHETHASTYGTITKLNIVLLEGSSWKQVASHHARVGIARRTRDLPDEPVDENFCPTCSSTAELGALFDGGNPQPWSLKNYSALRGSYLSELRERLRRYHWHGVKGKYSENSRVLVELLFHKKVIENIKEFAYLLQLYMDKLVKTGANGFALSFYTISVSPSLGNVWFVLAARQFERTPLCFLEFSSTTTRPEYF